MMNVVVMGLQWGDEGKGKAIDYLAGSFDVVVRYQGGHNAGHTVYYKGQKVILHLLPSGIFSPETVSVIGNGVVVNPLQLVKEMKGVQEVGIDLKNLVVSANAPLILPYHENLDIIFENSRYLKIGTTRRGIGPAYEDFLGRRGLFVQDLLDKDTLRKKLVPVHEYYNKLIEVYGGEEIPIDSYLDSYAEAGKFLKSHIKNSINLLHQYYLEKKVILFEGAQGVLLDINFGTYPFVTSSNPTIGGIFTGTGLSHKAIDKVIGVCKAYTTRVGEGPFPSELSGDVAHQLREKGNEYGSTTGRPRRVGWLDLVALKYAIMINGLDELFLTKLDVLDEFDEINVVTAYEVNGEQTDVFSPSVDFLSAARPVTKAFRGWKQHTGDVRQFSQFSPEVIDYLKFIEEYSSVKISHVSVGTNRDQTIKI